MKVRILVFLLLGVISACAACQQDEETSVLLLDKGDLPRIKERGEIRVVVPMLSEGCLPRQGIPAAVERELAETFADRLGVDVTFVCTEGRDDLLSMIEEGKGDLVAAQLTATPERQERVAFSRPTATVSEWLVGAKGEEDLPKSIDDLEGREVHVRKSSSFARTLERISRERGLDIRIVPVNESLDTEMIVFEVGAGKRPLTVADSVQLESIESFNTDIKRLFPLVEGQQIGWAMRKDNPELLAAANVFITEHFMTGHRRELSTGDLDSIIERGSLRVLTSNNAVNYFLYRGQQKGFDYEIAKMAAERLGVRLEMIVPPRFELLMDWLVEGRGDVIAGSLTVTPDREEVIAFSRPYLYVEEVLVQAAQAEHKLEELRDLEGQEIHVQKSSSYFRSLEKLQDSFGPFTIVEAPEELEIETLLDWVAQERIPYTVADSHLLEAELTYRDDIEAAFPLTLPTIDENPLTSIAFGVRKDNVQLKSFLDGFIKDIYRGLEYNDALNRYFKTPHNLRRVKEERAHVSGRISRYDDILKMYSKQYGLDWRLMAAQAYEESRFRPRVQSWAGAVGLFQVMPSTGLELGFADLMSEEANIHAGILQMYRLLERIDARISFKHRVRFALAAYNAGWGHVQDARRLAAQKGWDPNKWFGHVEKAMLLLEQPNYHRNSRYGYVRGSETVGYVSKVQNRYDHYVRLFPA
jgi:membrane-bound lytic murein transglycosylase F